MTRDHLSTISVLLVDDHPVVREGLVLLLAREEILVCGQAASRAQALRALGSVQPDVAIVDLSLGGESGLELIAELDERGIPVLVYSMHEDGDHIRHAFAAGARGYVTKGAIRTVLTDAIREVAAGREYLSPKAAASIAAEMVNTRKHAGRRELSEREREVYRLLGEGGTTSEIAATMGVSIHTIESYCARVMEKMGVEGMRPLRRSAIHASHATEE